MSFAIPEFDPDMTAVSFLLSAPPPDLAGAPATDGSAAAHFRDDGVHSSCRALLAVALLALFLRVLAAGCMAVVCDDAFYYFNIAAALGRRDFDAAFDYLHLNTYPAILLLLHNAGLNWVLAGKLWSVLCGSLAVLPLYGWTRRAAGDRIGLLCAFLYAVHPDLVEYSAEPIREATFWLFFNAGLYALLRAFQESEWRWFALSGSLAALAVHTRAEGAFLFIAALCLAGGQWLSHNSRRWKCTGGLLLSLAMTPVLLGGVNIVLWQVFQRTEWGSLKYGQMAWAWANSLSPLKTEPAPPAAMPADAGVRPASREDAGQRPVAQKPARKVETTPATASRPNKRRGKAARDRTEVAASSSNVADSASPLPESESALPGAAVTLELGRLLNPEIVGAPPSADDSQTAPSRTFSLWHLKKFFVELARKFQPHYVFCALLGLFLWRKCLWRREFAAITVVSIVSMIAVWIRLWHSGHINGRYFFTTVILLLPLTAVGTWSLIHWIVSSALFAARPFEMRRRIVLGLLGLVALVAAVDAGRDGNVSRHQQAAAGEYLQRTYGPFDSALVRPKGLRLGYYLFGDNPRVEYRDKRVAAGVEEHRPAVLLLAPADLHPDLKWSALKAAMVHGYRRVEIPAEIFKDRDEWVVLIRPPGPPSVQTANGALLEARRQ